MTEEELRRDIEVFRKEIMDDLNYSIRELKRKSRQSFLAIKGISAVAGILLVISNLLIFGGGESVLIFAFISNIIIGALLIIMALII